MGKEKAVEHHARPLPKSMRTSDGHSQPTTNCWGIPPKGIGIKSQASSAWWTPCAREAQDVGGSLPTHTASGADGLATEACRQNEAARDQADRLTQA